MPRSGISSRPDRIKDISLRRVWTDLQILAKDLNRLPVLPLYMEARYRLQGA